MWRYRLKRTVVLSLLSGLFIMPCHAGAETEVKEYTDHQIAEADWESAKTEKDFWTEKGIRNGSEYTLNENTGITTELDKKNLVYYKTDPGPMDKLYAFGALVWGSNKSGTINMNGHDLSLRTGKGDLHRIGGSYQWGGKASAGMYIRSGSLTMKNPGDLSITGVDYGVYLFAEEGNGEPANSNLYIKNGGKTDRAVKIRSTGKGIYLQSTPGAARMTVDGNVDIEAPMGISVDRGEVTVGGGKIVSKGEGAVYANAQSHFRMNADIDGKGNVAISQPERNVQIFGDIRSKQNSRVFIGLGNSQSVLKGLFTTDFYTWPLHEWVWTASSGYLALKDGATWEHEKYGTGKDKNGKAEVGDSHLTRLNTDGGVIIQKDHRKIQIDDFRGNAKLIYAHQNDGTKKEDYTAGDFVIGKAAENSFLTVMTDNSGLDMGNKDKVSQALDALAGKIYYSNYVNDERNLKGKAVIAEGLTAASAELGFGNITFTSENGQGTVKSGDVTVTNPTPGTGAVDEKNHQIVEGVLKGGRFVEYWKGKGVTSGDRKYSFNKDVILTVEGTDATTEVHMNKGFAPIMWTGDGEGVIDMNHHSLKLVALKGTQVKFPHGILMHSGTLTIKNTKGIDISAEDGLEQRGIVVHGQTSMGAGYFGKGEAKLVIENRNTKEDTLKIRTKGKFEHYPLIEAKAEVNGTAVINIKGRVDLENQGDDTARVVRATEGQISIGSGRIVTNASDSIMASSWTDDEKRAMAEVLVNSTIEAYSAETDLAKPLDEKNVVEIKGNIISTKHARTAVSLTNKDSKLTGLVSGTTWRGTGSNYVTLKNGAVWENRNNSASAGGAQTNTLGSHVEFLQGGDAASGAGTIYQKDAKDIHVKNYKGHTTVIYEHDTAMPANPNMGLTIKGGDIRISKAAANSGILLRTDNTGLNTSSDKEADKNLVNATLNALANKLYYEAYKGGEKNLTGKVEIAEGLTSQAVSKRIEDISFKEENGQGYVKGKETPGGDPKPPALDNPVHHQIVEANHFAEESREYWAKAGVYDGKGHYKFTKDLELVANAEDDTVGTINDNKFAAIYWNGDVDGEIDMTGHKLELKAATKTLPKQNPNTITVYSGTLRIKNTNGIYIESDPTGSLYGRGILVAGIKSDDKWNSGKGNSKLIIENDDDPAHAVKIRVKNTGEDFGAIEAQKHNGSALVDIKGLVDIDSQMWRAIESHGAKITIGGGTIKGTDVASLAAYTGGSILINAKLNDQNKLEATSTTRPVKITGDISAESGGHIMLGLNNKDSFLKGLASTDINGINPDTQKWGPIHGKVSMILANGAVWEHKQVGVGYYHKKGGNINYKNRGKGESIDSHVTNLRADKGILLQNDPHKLTIDKYEGNMTLIYSHENAGTKAEDYKNGDVHIKEAAADSYITMVTDNSGIKMDDEKQVSEALNALAGKLYYEAFTKGEKNLKGQATIAEGLTASSRTLKTADLEYTDKNGQGYIKRMNPNPNPNPNPDPDPKPPIHEGDNETAMMRGGKSARMADILLWTSDTNDLQRRMGDLRLAKGETGLWAKYQGGKNKLNEQKAYISQDYNMAQVGYDKQIGDWTVGGAIHYGTANNKYIRGDGKSKITSLALYGTKQGQDGSYIDLILKGSRLSNDYTLTEDQLGRTMSGNYNTNGISFSAEYGKRMQQENGFYIEPSIELTAGRLGGKDYAATSTFSGNQKMYIHHEAYNSLIGRIGISAGQETERSNLFAKIALAKEFSGKSDSDFRAEGEKERHEANIDLKDSWIDVEIGGSATLGEDTYLYGTYTMNFGGKVENKWRVDAGIRYRF